jgi:colanic acid biosynthesis glycosyl transferase WcaI
VAWGPSGGGTVARIILINRYFWPDESATSQLVTDLATDLAASGWEVEAVTSRQRIDDPAAALPAAEVCRGVRVHRVATSRFGRGSLVGRAIDYLTFYVAAAVTLVRRVRPGDILIAKTDPPLVGLLAVSIGAVKGATAIHWWQDVYPEVAEQLGVGAALRLRRPLRALRNWLAGRAVRNVVIGRCMRDYLVAQGVPAASIVVIPNWVEDAAIRPVRAADNVLRRDWGLAGRFVVGYSGNLGLGHEFEALLGAARLLADRPEVVFLFIGAGARRAALEARCAELGLGNVVFRPFQPRAQLPQSLGVPDLHLVSLRAGLEGLIVPSKFYGALAAGRPVLFIGPAASEVARAIGEWQCGFAVPDATPEALAALIAGCVDDPARVAAMGERARRAIDTRYGRAAALRAWREVLAPATTGVAVCPATREDHP